METNKKTRTLKIFDAQNRRTENLMEFALQREDGFFPLPYRGKKPAENLGEKPAGDSSKEEKVKIPVYCNVTGDLLRVEYKGKYLESYAPIPKKDSTADKNRSTDAVTEDQAYLPPGTYELKSAPYTEIRTGLIYDLGHNRAVVFKQCIRKRADPWPDIVLIKNADKSGQPFTVSWDKNTPKVLELALSFATPLNKRCNVVFFMERDLSDDEKHELGINNPEKKSGLPQLSQAEIDRLLDKSQTTLEDAVNAIIAHFPDLTTPVLHAGMLHARNSSWKDIIRTCKKSKSTVSEYINRFYEITGWPRKNRRMGMGKKQSFDETRDSDAIQQRRSDEHPEHCEHPCK